MQRLTAMTLGAAFLGVCGFVYDANAQAPSANSCATHEATVYFAPDSSTLTEYGHYAVDKMAEAARACGAEGVVVQASGGERAFAVASALSQRGVKPVITTTAAFHPSGDTMMARSVTLRVASPVNAAS